MGLKLKYQDGQTPLNEEEKEGLLIKKPFPGIIRIWIKKTKHEKNILLQYEKVIEVILIHY